MKTSVSSEPNDPGQDAHAIHQAGLARVHAEFPGDVQLALANVRELRANLIAPCPEDEPWPPMRVAAGPQQLHAPGAGQGCVSPGPAGASPLDSPGAESIGEASGSEAGLHWRTATELAAAYRAGTASPVDVVGALLHRIDALDGTLHAFIRVDTQAAMAQARAAQARLAAGAPLGPLDGIPIGIKDIIDVAGQPTTCHSLLRLGHCADRDAFVIGRLREAGAVLLGKLALHEFAVGGPPVKQPFPSACNPWNLSRHAGGSSSGSGAALAAGLVPLALGTDTGGSIRNPAGHCGVAGLKPTYGLLSRRGAYPLSFTLDHIGPMARSVADLAALLEVLSAHDPDDPGSHATEPQIYGRDLGSDVAGLRIGLVRHFHTRDMPAHAEVSAAYEHAAMLLREAGAVVQEVELPALRRFTTAQRVIFQSEAWAIHAATLRERPQDYSVVARQKLLPGAFLSAGEYVQAQQLRTGLIRSVDRALQEVDVLMTANSMDPPCDIHDADACRVSYGRHARSPFNLTGHPALALMAGLSIEGLPLSVQFVGKAFDEGTLLRVGAQFERAAGLRDVHPPGY